MGDLKRKNWQLAYPATYPVGTHREYTLLQITGSGILTTCMGNDNLYYALEIDGQIYSMVLPANTGCLPMFYRFKSNVKVSCSATNGAILFYLLD